MDLQGILLGDIVTDTAFRVLHRIAVLSLHIIVVSLKLPGNENARTKSHASVM